MSITATFQQAFRINRLDPCPMEILKCIDRPTTAVMEDEIMGYVPPNQKKQLVTEPKPLGTGRGPSL